MFSSKHNNNEIHYVIKGRIPSNNLHVKIGDRQSYRNCFIQMKMKMKICVNLNEHRPLSFNFKF